MVTRKIGGVRHVWTVLWKSGTFLVVWALLMAPLIVPLGPALADWEKSSPLQARLYLDSVGAATILVATWLVTRFVDRRPFLSLGFAPASFGRNALAGVTVGALWLAVSLGSAWAAGWVAVQAQGRFSGALLVGAALGVFLNVLTQQLLLCGYIFQVIQREANAGLAVNLSALLFVGYHVGAFAGAWLPAVNVFLAGVLFCLAYGLTETLWFPVFIHFAWNVLLGPALGLTVSASSRLGSGWQVVVVTGPQLWTGGSFGLEGGLIVTLTTGISILAMALIRRSRRVEPLTARSALAQ